MIEKGMPLAFRAHCRQSRNNEVVKDDFPIVVS